MLKEQEKTRTEGQLGTGQKHSAEALNATSLPVVTGLVTVDLRDASDDFDTTSCGRAVRTALYEAPAGVRMQLIVKPGSLAPIIDPADTRHLAGIEIACSDATTIWRWVQGLRGMRPW